MLLCICGEEAQIRLGRLDVGMLTETEGTIVAPFLQRLYNPMLILCMWKRLSTNSHHAQHGLRHPFRFESI